MKKRTLNHFFVRTRQDPSDNQQCSDREPSTSQVMLNQSPEAPTVSEPQSPRTIFEAKHSEMKRRKVYAFRREWLDQFPWLRYSKTDNVMYCIYCNECGKAIAGNSAFVTGSGTFWIETLKKHNASAKHITCRDKCTAQVSPLPAALQRQAAANRSSGEAEMITKYNVAYNIAKELPFTKFISKIILHKKNGLNINPIHSNHVACAQFTGVIADTLKEKTSAQIANSHGIHD